MSSPITYQYAWYKYRLNQRLYLFHSTPYCIVWNRTQTWLFFVCLDITVYFQAWDIWFSKWSCDSLFSCCFVSYFELFWVAFFLLLYVHEYFVGIRYALISGGSIFFLYLHFITQHANSIVKASFFVSPTTTTFDIVLLFLLADYLARVATKLLL